MGAKKILTNLMTSFEKEDMAGKNEWLREINPRTNRLGGKGLRPFFTEWGLLWGIRFF